MVEMKANSGVLLMKHSKIHSCICQLEHQLLLKDSFWVSHLLVPLAKTKKNPQKSPKQANKATTTHLPSPPPTNKQTKKTNKTAPIFFFSQTVREICANRSHKISLDIKSIVKIGNLWNMVESFNKATVQLLNSHHTASHQDKTQTHNLRHAPRGHFSALSPLLPCRLTALFPIKDIL